MSSYVIPDPMQVRCGWGLTPGQESMLTSAVFAGTMLGVSSWGAIADGPGPPPRIRRHRALHLCLWRAQRVIAQLSGAFQILRCSKLAALTTLSHQL